MSNKKLENFLELENECLKITDILKQEISRIEYVKIDSFCYSDYFIIVIFICAHPIASIIKYPNQDMIIYKHPRI